MKGRHYTIPPRVKEEFEMHVRNIAKSMSEPDKIPSKRSFRNMHLMQKHDWIGQYYFSLAGRPGGVILSKGWSFNPESAKTVNKLISEGWYCIAALQAVDLCNEFGVKPHAYCAMDPQKVLVQYLDKVHQDAWLFHDVMVDPGVWDYPGKHVVFASYSAHIHDKVLDNAGMFVINLPNHTVSEIMQSVLQHLGARRIYFAGVDYSVPADQAPTAAAGYDWFDIKIGDVIYKSNIHYCLGLQAFLRHMIVDHFSPESFEEFKDQIAEATKDCDRSTGQPKEVPMNWKTFRFFQRIAEKKKNSGRWSRIRTGLTVEKFGQELVDDFNP